MKKRRWLALAAAALTMVLFAGSVGASAETLEPDPILASCTMEAWYAPGMTEEDFPEIPAVMAIGETENTERMDYEDAVAVMREACLNREPLHTISFRTDKETFQENVGNLLNRVFAHGISPDGGDYLRFMTSVRPLGDGKVYLRQAADGTYYTECSFSLVYYTTVEQEAVVDEKVAELLNGWNLAEQSDYRILRAIYDYICEHVEYDRVHQGDVSYKPQFTAYAALTEGKAVCQGYASLFYRLAMELDIDARIVGGTSRLNGVDHAWNLVKLESCYYYVDSTWDAGQETYRYFLKSGSTFNKTHRIEDQYNTADFASEYPVSRLDYDCIFTDGTLGREDVGLLNRYFAGWTLKETFDRKAIDFNGDGMINRKDAMYLARHLEGWPGYPLKHLVVS